MMAFWSIHVLVIKERKYDRLVWHETRSGSVTAVTQLRDLGRKIISFADGAAPEGASSSARLTARLKRCPDTKRAMGGLKRCPDTKRAMGGLDTKLAMGDLGLLV
jgi:hypothetical protein